MDSASRRDFLKQLAAGIGLTATGALDPVAVLGSAVGAKTYTNPVYAGSMPDPGVLRHRGEEPHSLLALRAESGAELPIVEVTAVRDLVQRVVDEPQLIQVEHQRDPAAVDRSDLHDALPAAVMWTHGEHVRSSRPPRASGRTVRSHRARAQRRWGHGFYG